jgi:polysaccharide export outer membrane protein
MAEYKISVGDEIEVRFADRADMIQTFQVQPDGLIRPPYLPPLMAAGRTLKQLTADLTKTLAGLVIVHQKPRYILTVGDELDLRFVNNGDLNQTVRIRPDGRVTLPYIRSLSAEGKTPEDFENELRKRYADYLKLPDLTVSVHSFSSNLVRMGDRNVPAGLANSEPIIYLRKFATAQIFVGGEVVKPGVISFRNNLTLLQAIIEAGGDKSTGEMRNVIVLRKSADSGFMIRRNLLSDLTESTTNDIPLQPLDIVIIPKSLITKIDEISDQYLNQPTIFMRNSPFNFFYDLTPNSTVTTTTVK